MDNSNEDENYTCNRCEYSFKGKSGQIDNRFHPMVELKDQTRLFPPLN